MFELGFRDQTMLSTARIRDRSPDSVILGLFSSTSASCDRSSSTSDAHEHDSIVFQVSQHFAECGPRESSGRPYPDQGKPSTARHSTRSLTKAHEAGCHEKKSRSEVILNKQRPVSLDMNNVATSSPRVGGMKKATASKAAGMFPSPGTPQYRYSNMGIQRGWCSERVSSNSLANRRHITTTTLPYNNGRTLPSKWEDAERWIFSPASVDRGVQQSLPPPQRRPKSKSGPLGPPEVAGYSLYLPLVPISNGGNSGNVVTTASFQTSVEVTDETSACSAGTFLTKPEPCITRSASVNICSGLLGQTSLPPSEANDATNCGYAISRRDMATQMTPDGSSDSSPRAQSFFSSSIQPTGLPISKNGSSSISESMDVQIDECVKMSRWSKKSKVRRSIMSSGNGNDWIKYATDSEFAVSEIAETAKCTAKVKREEAKIAAWENLQKAKAEAAIRELEVKLEKKRSSSMEKIIKKLRSAQKRAQGMRNSVLASQPNSTSISSVSRLSIGSTSFQRTRQIGPLSGCFTCHGG